MIGTYRKIGNGALAVAVAATVFGCATERTKYSDKNLRVAIDSESIDYRQYVSLEHSLVASGKFVVVDRAAGFRAIKQEQEREHRSEPNRYADREKFSQWAKLYGVGAVIIGNVQCQDKPSFWNNQVYKQHCIQFIQMTDANTGEVIASVQNEVSGDRQETLAWSDAVDKLVDAYPRWFEDHPDHARLVEYKDESEHLAREHDTQMGRVPASTEIQSQ